MTLQPVSSAASPSARQVRVTGDSTSGGALRARPLMGAGQLPLRSELNRPVEKIERSTPLDGVIGRSTR